MTSKTFAVAGVSTLNGVTKFRLAKDMTRVKVLAKNGHTDIQLVELPVPMTKEAAIAHLRSIDFCGCQAIDIAETVTEAA
jgi:hypothetical protein